MRFPCRSEDDHRLTFQAGANRPGAARTGPSHRPRCVLALRVLGRPRRPGRSAFARVTVTASADLPDPPDGGAAETEGSLLVAVLASDAEQAATMARNAMNAAPDVILFVDPAPDILRLNRLRLSGADFIEAVAHSLQPSP